MCGKTPFEAETCLWSVLTYIFLSSNFDGFEYNNSALRKMSFNGTKNRFCHLSFSLGAQFRAEKVNSKIDKLVQMTNLECP